MQKGIEIFTPDENESTGIEYSDNRVSAGFPSPAEHTSTVKLDLNKELIKNPASTFYARVKGVSMIDAGIDDGDLVLIKRCERVREGRIAAFLYDNSETTLKRFKQDKNAIYLIPENDAMEPIVISGQNREKLIIQGEAVMVLKDL